MTNYEPLYDYLIHLPLSIKEKTLTFGEVIDILKDELPDSAYKHRAWWANSSSPTDHRYAQNWLLAGWKVDFVNQEDFWVRFQRFQKS